MVRIGLLSDTHGYWHEKLFNFFGTCDQVWHCGDWGSIEIYNTLNRFKPVTGVWGNIDGQDIRALLPEKHRFTVEAVDVFMTHIGGYPGKYSCSALKEFQTNPPKLFVCGHSHILKVMYDKKLQLLHINPGAAGKYGFHAVSTAIRFEINHDRMNNLEIIEMKK
ncbi:MAG: Calcineurin-like phosphoesterase superfamily domain protein [Bacteroidetes bacterium ADurb.Bin408]|nr:MAG: Calcineurin-like phosphoesterase superfamily domain protein [Bacteroidetes bacterium ADurb.Bin408]